MSRKVDRTATFLLLHPLEKGNDKGLPDILAFMYHIINTATLNCNQTVTKRFQAS